MIKSLTPIQHEDTAQNKLLEQVNEQRAKKDAYQQRLVLTNEIKRFSLVYTFLCAESLVQLVIVLLTTDDKDKHNRRGVSIMLGCALPLMIINNVLWVQRTELCKSKDELVNNEIDKKENCKRIQVQLCKCFTSHIFEYVYFFIASTLLMMTLPPYYLPIQSPHKFVLWNLTIILLQTIYLTLPFATQGRNQRIFAGSLQGFILARICFQMNSYFSLIPVDESPSQLIRNKINPGLIVWDEFIHIFLPILPFILTYTRRIDLPTDKNEINMTIQEFEQFQNIIDKEANNIQYKTSSRNNKKNNSYSQKAAQNLQQNDFYSVLETLPYGVIITQRAMQPSQSECENGGQEKDEDLERNSKLNEGNQEMDFVYNNPGFLEIFKKIQELRINNEEYKYDGAPSQSKDDSITLSPSLKFDLENSPDKQMFSRLYPSLRCPSELELDEEELYQYYFLPMFLQIGNFSYSDNDKKLLSLNDIITQTKRHSMKKYYKVVLDQEISQDNKSIKDPDKKQQQIFEISTHLISQNEKHNQIMLCLNDISLPIKNELAKTQADFRNQLSQVQNYYKTRTFDKIISLVQHIIINKNANSDMNYELVEILKYSKILQYQHESLHYWNGVKLNKLVIEFVRQAQPVLEHIKSVTSMFNYKEENIEIIGSPDLVKLCTDWKIFEIILFQLVDNASKNFKIAPKLKIEFNFVEMKSRQFKSMDSNQSIQGQYSGYLTTTVTDFGTGIKPDQIKSIKNSLKTPKGGIGLELAHNLTHAMSGEVHILSVENEGTSFQFSMLIRDYEFKIVPKDLRHQTFSLLKAQQLTAKSDEFMLINTCEQNQLSSTKTQQKHLSNSFLVNQEILKDLQFERTKDKYIKQKIEKQQQAIFGNSVFDILNKVKNCNIKNTAQKQLSQIPSCQEINSSEAEEVQNNDKKVMLSDLKFETVLPKSLETGNKQVDPEIVLNDNHVPLTTNEGDQRLQSRAWTVGQQQPEEEIKVNEIQVKVSQEQSITEGFEMWSCSEGIGGAGMQNEELTGLKQVPSRADEMLSRIESVIVDNTALGIIQDLEAGVRENQGELNGIFQIQQEIINSAPDRNRHYRLIASDPEIIRTNVGNNFANDLIEKGEFYAVDQNLSNNHDRECTCAGTVLIAEDNLMNLFPITSMFDERNILYDIAYNGQIEVKMLKRNVSKTCCQLRYKMIFTDLNMPVMDGYMASRQISTIIKELNAQTDPGLGSNPGKISIPIIAMSAFEAECITSKLQANGITDYIEKPFPQSSFDMLLNAYYYTDN